MFQAVSDEAMNKNGSVVGGEGWTEMFNVL